VPTPRLRASVACHAEGLLLVVRLRDPVTGEEAIYPPGGALEPGETPAQAAEREAREETGVTLVVDPASEYVLHHPFRWAGVDYDVTTHYFAASLDRAVPLPSVSDATYHLGASWRPVEEALEEMRVHPAIARAVARVLGELACSDDPELQEPGRDHLQTEKPP
jgi:8-oxo-dGTP pyrophosphatase MutT (NUDIX family)